MHAIKCLAAVLVLWSFLVVAIAAELAARLTGRPSHFADGEDD